MFGDDILATTVCKPMDKVTGLAERTMWFPQGTDWYDVSTGTMYKGGSEHTLLYTIDENPYFVKAGAVIPMAGPQIMTLQKQSPELKLFVVPGQCDSSTQVYEDDGQSQAYDTEYAVTKITKTIEGNLITLKVSPREGFFKGMLDNRRISVVLDGFCTPANIKLNGQMVPYSRFASYEQENGTPVWGYDGNNFQTILWLAETPADQELEIVVSFEGLDGYVLPNGMKGLVGRMMAITPEAKYCFAQLRIKDFQLPSEFLNVAQCGSYITEDPFNFDKYFRVMDTKAMIDNINSWEKLSSEFKTKVSAQTMFEK